MKPRFGFLVPALMGVLCLFTGLLQGGCSASPAPAASTRSVPPASSGLEPSQAVLDPTSGSLLDLPTPNDILRNPQTGQNALPRQGEPFDSFNSISGFSTTGDINIPVAGDVDASTVNSSTVLVFNLATGQQVTDLAYRLEAVEEEGVARDLLFNVSTSGGRANLVITPRTPLAPGTRFLVLVTGEVKDSNGQPLVSDTITGLTKLTDPLVDANGNPTLSGLQGLSAQELQQLEQLRQFYNQAVWGPAEQLTGTDRAFFPTGFSFTTQRLFDAGQQLYTRAQNAAAPTVTVVTRPPDLTNFGLPANGVFDVPGLTGAADPLVNGYFEVLDALTEQALGLPAGSVDIPRDGVGGVYTGLINNVPHYLDPADPVNGFFDANLTDRGPVQVPFVVFTPGATGGNLNNVRPVVIFQHGITRRKEDAAIVASAFNSQGTAVFAIDMVAHGERIFGDLVDNTTGLPPGDGQPDPSGTFYINLQNPRKSRDNLRQSFADLFTVRRLIGSGAADLDGDGIPDLTPAGAAAPTFLGQSLGAIVGIPFVALDPNVTAATLNVGGARLVDLLLNPGSSVGAQVLAGLASQGVTPGTSDFFAVKHIFETVVEDAEPANYAAHLLAGDLSNPATPNNALFQMIVNDRTVLNRNNEFLAAALGAPQVQPVQLSFDGLNTVAAGTTANPAAGPASGTYQFADPAIPDPDNPGQTLDPHGFLLSTTVGGNATAQAQTQAVTYHLTFLGTGGQAPVIVDPTGVSPDLLPGRFDIRFYLESLVGF